jgi:spermine/spermidine synthase
VLASDRRDIFLTTFSILVLELAVIRWMSQQITVFAYLNNVLLMAAFLGMGLGVGLGRRWPSIFHATLPALAALSAILAFPERLGLARLRFPDPTVALWGQEQAVVFGRSLVIILVLFVLTSFVFVCAGAKVGELFARSAALDAYSSDLAGSLIGVLAMTLLSALQTAPPVWFVAGGIGLVWLSRRWWSWVSFAAVIALTFLSIRGAVFSPYYRIDVDRATRITGAPLRLSVNRDFHQFIHDLSPRHIDDPAVPRETRARLREAELMYRFPFLLSARKDRALVVGAGTGNDVAAALRDGFKDVVSVDIDPRIIDLGKELHPEKPYSDPRTRAVVNDARAYFEQHRSERFDVVDFGLLDSHAMFSSMGTLRLDNYVYTVESIRAAWRMVGDPGVLSVSFSIGDREWLSDRLDRIVFEATGVEPMIVPHGLQSGRFFVVAKGIDLHRLQQRMRFATVSPSPNAERIRVARDDWPFLYLRPGSIPVGYLAVLAVILAVAIAGTRAVFGRRILEKATFDGALFLMGAAFLLIETRSVTDLSLLFGSTWIVNAAVFGGILAVVWLANLLVRRSRIRDPRLVFVGLFAALVVNYFVRPDVLLTLPIVARGIAGGLLAALPVGFAGVIFSALFAQTAEPDAALGCNLLGAVIGGCLEYLSMWTGLRALTLLALVLYLGALLVIQKRATAVRAVLARPRQPVLFAFFAASREPESHAKPRRREGGDDATPPRCGTPGTRARGGRT